MQAITLGTPAIDDTFSCPQTTGFSLPTETPPWKLPSLPDPRECSTLVPKSEIEWKKGLKRELNGENGGLGEGRDRERGGRRGGRERRSRNGGEEDRWTVLTSTIICFNGSANLRCLTRVKKQRSTERHVAQHDQSNSESQSQGAQPGESEAASMVQSPS